MLNLQEDTVIYMQHMVLSLSMRVPGDLSVHSLSENSHSSCVLSLSMRFPGGLSLQSLSESSYSICVPTDYQELS